MTKALPLSLLAVAVLCGCASNQKKNPKMEDPIYLYQLGISQFNQGHMQEAEKYFKDSLLLDPKSVVAWNYLGLTYLLSQHFEEARKSLDKAIQIQPSFADAHNNLGTVFLQTGDLARAEAEFDLARRDTVYSQNPQVWFNLGMVSFQKGRYADAVTQFTQALDLNKAYGIGYLNRGKAYEKMGQPGDATADFRKFLELRPDDPEGLYFLGRCLVNNKNQPEGRPLLERAWLISPSSPWGGEAKKLLDILPR